VNYGPGRLPQPATVREVRVENPRTRTLVLDAAWQATPGQFAMVWLPGLDEKPFGVRHDDPLSFTVTAVGPFSRVLNRLAVGERVWVRGPFGRGYRPVGNDHLLIAGGYGVVPLQFLASRLVPTGGRVRVVNGARSAKDLLLDDAFRATGAEVWVATEDGSAGTRGLVTDVVGDLLALDPPTAVYACGPRGMLTVVEALCRRHRLPGQLSWEAYMRCGMGLCGSCEHDGWLVCSDGPVLDVA
jgi:dihydroorotate dehydrogenase electron transfer subunit